MTKIFFSTVVLAVSLVVGQSAPSHPSSAPNKLPQIQSQSLRIEFDKNMRSRVIARLNGKEVPLGGVSDSETVQGNERSWYNFSLNSQTHERISDNFGGGEKLTL